MRREPLTDDGALPLEWDDVRRRFAGERFYWLASGPGHVRPVLSVWVGDGPVFTSGPATRKARELRSDGRCSLAARLDGLDLVVEGTAARATTGLDEIAAAYDEKYGWPVTVVGEAFEAPYGAPTAGPPPYEPWRIRPSAVFALGTDDETAPRSTAFRF